MFAAASTETSECHLRWLREKEQKYWSQETVFLIWRDSGDY